MLTRLGSGERINRASDDAGSLSISESLKSRAKIAATAIRNSNDGLSALNIADSALGEISGILGRMSELAEQSANGTISNAQRSTLNKEFRALGTEISRLAEVTLFNGRELILQRPSGGGDGGPTSGGNIDVQGTVYAVFYDEYQYQGNSIELQVGFTSSLASRIETESINASLTGLGLGGYYQVTGQPEREYLHINIRNVSEARTALTSVTTATERISTYRGKIGATQARLGVAIGSLSVAHENFLAANSRIRSADYAAESAQLTRLSIARDAGTAVLAQANQQPALALTLLRS